MPARRLNVQASEAMPSTGVRRRRRRRWSRQSWCPRCDELRPGRAGGRCPVCQARLVTLPAVTALAPDPARAALLLRLRGMLPGLRAAALTLGAVGLVVGSFVAGRATRSSAATAPGAGSAAAGAPSGSTPTATTQPGPGVRLFNWHAAHGRVTVTLRSIENGSDFSTVVLNVAGLDGGVTSFVGLRIDDARGNDLTGVGGATKVPVGGDRNGFPLGGGSDYLVQFSRPIDLGGVARVELRGLTVVQPTEELVSGILYDPALRRSIDQNGQATATAAQPCATCRLLLRCATCKVTRILASVYRQGRVVLLFAPADPAHWSLSANDQNAKVDGPNGQVSIDAQPLASGGTMITFLASSLALISPTGQATMHFTTHVFASRQLVAQGPWRIDQGSAAAGAGG
jgi:hypothetical protein